MSEWKVAPLKNCFAIGLRNGLTKPMRVRGSGVRMVNMKEIFAYDVIDDSTPMELVPVTEKEYEASVLMYNDLLFARQSLVESGAGKIAIYKGHSSAVFESHLIRCRIDKAIACADYIFYLFKSPVGKGTVSTIVQQTAAAGIRGSDLENLEFSFPPLHMQQAIAEVLSSLDDKIGLLVRQNSTMETLAQTYFRRWFEETPNEEWEEKGLDEIANFLNGLPLQNYPCKGGEPMNVIKIRELNSGYSDNSDICSSDVPEKYIVHLGDVIFSWSGSLVVDIWKYEEGALNQHLFKVTSDKYPKWFYYYWIKYHLPEFRIIAESKATTMGHIQRGHLSAAKVLVPSNDELKAMSETMQPLIEKIERNNAQILTLQKLRDTLLPKLISGEVRVKQ